MAFAKEYYLMPEKKSIENEKGYLKMIKEPFPLNSFIFYSRL